MPERNVSPAGRLAVGPNLALLMDWFGDPATARRAVSTAAALRTSGYLLADVNPLSSAFDLPLGPEQRKYLDQLAPDQFADFTGLSGELVGGRAARESDDAQRALVRLHEIYTGTTGYEFGHMRDASRREWLEDRAETTPAPMSDALTRAVLARLARVEGFERFMQRAFVGEKRFSLEGTDVIVPMLERIIERAYVDRFDALVFGTVSRGRLNLLTQLFGVDPAPLFAEFDHVDAGEPQPTGDVKYHRGGEASYSTNDGDHAMRMVLLPNPSHLEFVTPVALGMARALQDADPGSPRSALPVLTHGDAAFAGQGIVAESLNLGSLVGYRTGGTLHVLMNNQIGFTTDPAEARSTRYASDLARAYDVPVVHVNADDPEACLRAVDLAYDYRLAFGADFMIDLVGYRRRGHQEVDDPSFTQPLMYQALETHPTVFDLYATLLEQRGVLDPGEKDRLESAVATELQAARDAHAPTGVARPRPLGRPDRPDTRVAVERLAAVNAALCDVPAGVTVSEKLEKRVLAPKRAFDVVSWGHAETLAWATLVQDGVAVRVTGEDVERGTFAQRHLVWHDVHSGERYCALQHVPGALARFEVANAPLSEAATLAFEYGYSIGRARSITVWEAQFGDFANVAQPIIDHFVMAGSFRWDQTSSLVLLLPHGLEGQGAEHSSARPERFLQLAAENAVRVANCSTAAQYFHLLREHALARRQQRPLIVFTPKRLLRDKAAAATPLQLSEGRFEPVLVDASEPDHMVRRVLLCSGKIGPELRATPASPEAPATAVVRLEQLYPLPLADLSETLGRFPGLVETAWVQEEPENMGAWTFVREPLTDLIKERGHCLRYIGRDARIVPAQGSSAYHDAEQHRVLAEARATWT